MASLADLKICGDTGWRYEPRYAPQDVLDSEGTVMHHLSNPSPKRTVTGWLLGDGSNYGAGASEIDGGIVLSVSAQRFQNDTAGNQVWRITVEMQQAL